MSAPNTLKDSQSNIISQLGTWTHTTTQASLYSMSVQLLELPPSGISVLIQHNGSTIATASAPAASQQLINLQALNIFCAQGDTISTVLSSANPSDALPNIFKALISVGRGSNL